MSPEGQIAAHPHFASRRVLSLALIVIAIAVITVLRYSPGAQAWYRVARSQHERDITADSVFWNFEDRDAIVESGTTVSFGYCQVQLPTGIDARLMQRGTAVQLVGTDWSVYISRPLVESAAWPEGPTRDLIPLEDLSLFIDRATHDDQVCADIWMSGDEKGLPVSALIASRRFQYFLCRIQHLSGPSILALRSPAATLYADLFIHRCESGLYDHGTAWLGREDGSVACVFWAPQGDATRCLLYVYHDSPARYVQQYIIGGEDEEFVRRITENIAGSARLIAEPSQLESAQTVEELVAGSLPKP